MLYRHLSIGLKYDFGEYEKNNAQHFELFWVKGGFMRNLGKRFILAAAFALSGWMFAVNAQDMIIMKDGNIIDAKVMEIHPTEIRYKRLDNLDGPMIVIPSSGVLSIRYKNGTTDIISAAPAAAPATSAEQRAAEQVAGQIAGQIADQLSGTGGANARQNFVQESLQAILNSFPAIPIAGNNLKFLFARERWTATVNGENYLAGNIEVEETDGGLLLKLGQTHIWPGAVGKSVGRVARLVPGGGAAGNVLNTASGFAGSLVGAVEMSGPLYVLEYIAGPAAKLSFVRIEDSKDNATLAQAQPGRNREQSGDTPSTSISAAYTGQNKPFEFSIGLGVFGEYAFSSNVNKYDENNDWTFFDMGLNVSLNAEIYSYVLFDFSFNLMRRAFDNGNGWNGSGLELSLFCKYPFNIDPSLTLYPLVGLGYEMLLGVKYDDYYREFSREEIKDGDILFLKIGGGLNYNFNDHFRFNLKLLYKIFLFDGYMDQRKDYDEKFSRHGPNLFAGIKYVF
jgi:hypothetical protein